MRDKWVTVGDGGWRSVAEGGDAKAARPDNGHEILTWWR
jgi:hypothetical protein